MFRIQTRNKLALLLSVLGHAPKRSNMSLEGELRGLWPMDEQGGTFDETPALKRNTRSPKLDFVVLPVSDLLVKRLKEQLSKSGVFGVGGALVHVQIEHQGKLIFGAYDNFDPDCVVSDVPFNEEFLSRLREQGIIHGHY